MIILQQRETSIHWFVFQSKMLDQEYHPTEAPLLFGKFVRLKRDLVGSVRGTGLGLYISKQLVESMGGNIWVESSGVEGQGSRFSFTLPYAVPELIEQNNHGMSNHLDVLPVSSVTMMQSDEHVGVSTSKALEP